MEIVTKKEIMTEREIKSFYEWLKDDEDELWVGEKLGISQEDLTEDDVMEYLRNIIENNLAWDFDYVIL